MNQVWNCTLEIHGVYGAYYFRNIRDSTIIMGPCANSIYIDKCENSTLSIGAQQVIKIVSIELRVQNAICFSLFECI